MKALRQHRWRTITALFLLAFFVKVLVPAGFMPAPAGNGKTTIVICTAQGLATALVDSDEAPLPHSDNTKDKTGHASCPYAPVLTQGLSASAPVFSLHLTYPENPLPVRASNRLTGLSLKPWSSRGPPQFS